MVMTSVPLKPLCMLAWQAQELALPILEREFAAIRRRVNQPLVAEAERSMDGFLAGARKTSSELDKKKALCQAACKIWASGFDRPRISGNQRKFPNWKGASSKAKARLNLV